MKNFDAIIIGFGKCGKTLAGFMAKKNLKVAVIEQSDKMYGGTCINIGCIPTKTLVHFAKEANKEGSYEEKNSYFVQSIQKKNELTSLLRNKNYHLLADNPNITIYNGVGSFIGQNQVEVNTGSETIQLESSRIIINTGSETVIPPIPGVENNKYVYTSTSIMELGFLPKKLVIIGGGYIGLEFASMLASFGSSVTVLEGAPILIGREDRDIADRVKSVLEKKGIEFILNARVSNVNGNVVTYTNAEGKSVDVEGDAILLATGRKPKTDNLNLDKAGIELGERGAIKVNEKLQTTNPNVYAVGDVKGGLQFTYISLDDFRILRDAFFGDGKRELNDRFPVSYSVFIDPPLARIGINEDEAKSRNLNVKINKLEVAGIPRARTINEIDGLFKVIVDAQTDEILGCTLFGAESSEIINIVALAMKAGLKYTYLRDFIFTHPSMSESLNDLMNF